MTVYCMRSKMDSLSFANKLSLFLNKNPFLLIYIAIMFVLIYGVLWAYSEGLFN